MKPTHFFLSLLLILGTTLHFSCEKTIDLTCDETIYLPESLLKWFPYHNETGDTTAFWKFSLENNTYYMEGQTLTFCNADLDSQTWRLVTAVEKFNRATYEGCPIYQQVDYTIYNWKLGRHMNLGFVYRDSSFTPSAGNEPLYIPMLNTGTCTTAGEKGEGVLYGTCYSTTFEVDNYQKYEKVDYLQQFATPFSTYHAVFYVKLHHPDEELRYNIYIAENRGIVAYENQGVLWALR